MPVTGACTLISYVDSSGKFQDGRRTKVTFPPSTGATLTMSYDNGGNLMSIVGAKGATTLSSFSYTYAQGTQDVAQRQTMTDTNGTTTSYHYDAFGRLCWYATGSFTNACGSPPSGATSYTYDANGNRLSMVSGGTTTNYAYNAADELCARVTGGTASCSSPNYTYDANGNMLTGPSASYSYNAKDQTTSRTLGTTTHSFSYADADQTERVTMGGSNFAWSPLGLSQETGFYYTRDPEGGLLGEQRNGNNYYFLYDGLGSVVAVMDSTGTVVSTYSYDPWGKKTEGLQGTPSNFKFTGGYYDIGGTGGSGEIYLFGTRYYDALLGRWTQQDLAGGSIADPGLADGYVYVADDPVDLVDPMGLCPWYDAVCHVKHIYHGVTHFLHKHTWARCALMVAGAATIGGEFFLAAREAMSLYRAGKTLGSIAGGVARAHRNIGTAGSLMVIAGGFTGGCP